MRAGKLFKNEDHRWVIKFDYNYVLTSGDICEVQVAGHWIKTRIEHNGTEYYATVPGVKLYAGMLARISND